MRDHRADGERTFSKPRDSANGQDSVDSNVVVALMKDKPLVARCSKFENNGIDPKGVVLWM